MKLTNKYGLPESFAKFIRADKYSKGDSDISVTTLIDSPRISKLREAHFDSLEMDVTDRIPSMFGTAVHTVLQEIDEPSYEVEERMYAQLNGWTISGAVDVQEYNADNTITIMDYKVCSTWAVMHDKPEWEKQLNCYAWLVRKCKDKVVKKLQIVAILRDWNRRKARMESGYPQSNAVVVDVPLWDYEEQYNYLVSRVVAHQDAQSRFDFIQIQDGLPACSDEERWMKPSKWAVMKQGRKSAVKLFDSEPEAELFIRNSKGADALFVEHRPGEYTRCAGNFCGVSNFCKQYLGDENG